MPEKYVYSFKLRARVTLAAVLDSQTSVIVIFTLLLRIFSGYTKLDMVTSSASASFFLE